MEYTELDIRLKDLNPFSEIIIAKLNEIGFKLINKKIKINGICYI
jgi:hypothetical protein